MPLGFPIQQSEQTLTAARPSRFLTVFPFDYPKAQLQDLRSGYILFKEQKNAITLSGNGQTKKKKNLTPAISSQIQILGTATY